MVAVVTTDNPEDPEDLTDNEGEIEEDTGSAQKRGTRGQSQQPES